MSRCYNLSVATFQQRLFIIGFFLFSFNQLAFAQQDNQVNVVDQDEQTANDAAAKAQAASAPDLPESETRPDPNLNLSAAETRNKICNCRYSTDVPYRDRRGLITGFFGVQADMFSPVNYSPNYQSRNVTYQSYYGGQQNTGVDLVFGAKMNFLFGSLGASITGGFFTAKNETDHATLSVQPITLGGIFALDALFSEPYIVPYVVAGEYIAYYSETLPTQSVSGRTPMALFYAVGLMFQLDWLDTEAHATAFEDFGLENTFLFVEGRSLFKSADPVPNFSTPLQVNAGLRVEF